MGNSSFAEKESQLPIVPPSMCKPDSHVFYKMPTGGGYRCKRCGLVVNEISFQQINMRYLGSYVDDCSWVWKSQDMAMDQVKSFYIRVVDTKNSAAYRVQVTGSMLKWKKDGIGRPDLPADYFAEHQIELSEGQQNAIHGCLKNVDFTKHLPQPGEFAVHLVPGSDGSTYYYDLRIAFQNGKYFEREAGPAELMPLHDLLADYIRSTNVVPVKRCRHCGFDDMEMEANFCPMCGLSIVEDNDTRKTVDREWHSYSRTTKDGQFIETYGYSEENTAEEFFKNLSQDKLDSLQRQTPPKSPKPKKLLVASLLCFVGFLISIYIGYQLMNPVLVLVAIPLFIAWLVLSEKYSKAIKNQTGQRRNK